MQRLKQINILLQISNVSLADGGSYTCEIADNNAAKEKVETVSIAVFEQVDLSESISENRSEETNSHLEQRTELTGNEIIVNISNDVISKRKRHVNSGQNRNYISLRYSLLTIVMNFVLINR